VVFFLTQKEMAFKKRTYRLRSRRSAMSSAKKQARKPVDKSQNRAITALSRRLKKLETSTVERKYLTMHDAFSFGGLGQVKSRMIHRYNVGTYDGLNTQTLFGTTGIQGDFVYARYMIVDVEIQCQNPNVALGDEISPTTYTMWLLKARKENDAWNQQPALATTNGLNSTNIISQQVPGQSFVNPKGWKVIKQKTGVIGGVNAEAGFGIAHRRYRFKVPLNKKVMLQVPSDPDGNLAYPIEFQDWLWFAICANGSSVDGNEPHCSLSCMLCYDDAGDN